MLATKDEHPMIIGIDPADMLARAVFEVAARSAAPKPGSERSGAGREAAACGAGRIPGSAARGESKVVGSSEARPGPDGTKEDDAQDWPERMICVEQQDASKQDLREARPRGATLNDVFDVEVIGTEVLSYLGPRELFLFSLSNRRTLADVRKNLVPLFARHVPLEHDANDRTRLALGPGTSYPSQSSLFHSLFGAMAELDLDMYDYDSMEEARLDLRGLSRWTTGFRGELGRGTVSFSYQRRTDKREAYKYLSQIIEAGHGYVWRHTDPDARKVGSMKDWACYLISQSQSVGTWKWSCPHRSSPVRGTRSGMGVMISIADLQFEISFSSSEDWTLW